MVFRHTIIDQQTYQVSFVLQFWIFAPKMYGKLLYCNSLLINESENIIKNDNINLFTHHLHYLRFT